MSLFIKVREERGYNLNMDFSGLEKLSLVDYDDNISCTLFTAGCNFRCPFCHNSSLVLTPQLMDKIPFSKILDYLTKRHNVLDAVTITGGEPTLMDDLDVKCLSIKALGYKIKLDTNGTNPALVKSLVEKGLIDYVAMDIKNSLKKYSMTIGLSSFDSKAVEETISFLINGNLKFEFRTTVIDEFHEDSDFVEIGQLVSGCQRFFIQRYIDNEHCIQRGFHPVSKEKALGFKSLLEAAGIKAELRGYD